MRSIPIIQKDTGEARKLDISIALRKIYYQPVGYHRNAKKLHEASLNAGYDFTIDEVNKDRLFIRFINLGQSIFRVQVLALLLFLMKLTKQMCSTCLMIKLDGLPIFFALMWWMWLRDIKHLSLLVHLVLR